MLLATLRSRAAAATSIPRRTPAGRAQVRYLEDLYHGRLAARLRHAAPRLQEDRLPLAVHSRLPASTIPVGQLDSIEVLDVFDDPIQIPDAGEQKAKAVRVRLTSGTAASTTFVNHEVKVGDRWNWVLNDSAVSAYQAGRCPGT